MSISFDYSNALSFMQQHEVDYLSTFVKAAHVMLHEKKEPGSDYLGWVDLPHAYDKEEFARIKEAAERIRNTSDALIVIGIGGSYLGARAAIEALSHTFHNQMDNKTEI
ncbi:glucose-6-phosphate isomerase [Neobacillus niacini]|nr:glucose-6-phosphate isomerase [Neobacillus niacini]